ncbi:oxidoreductase [Leucobacter sp. GX24907]
MVRLIEQPISVGPFELRGRVYLPAHQPGLAKDGKVTDRYIAYHRQRAKAGMAMQVTGATPVAPSYEWADICLWNIDDSVIEGYRRLGAAVRAEGGRMIAQLAHPGPYESEGAEIIGASRDLSEVTRQVALEATHEQIDRVIQEYAAAADRCRRGELDGVEISMAHGLFIASFLSPLTNRRDDEFGGDFDRRLELPIRLLDAVREAVGRDLILGIRLGADDMVEGGLDPEEAGKIAAALESRVDYISVMVGNNNRLEARTRHWPPDPAQPGLFRHVVRTVKQHVQSVPVAGVGRILSADLAEDMIAAGDADMVGIVRAQVADPQLLPLSLAGRADEVRPCIGASVCINALIQKRPLECLVNPDVADSDELVNLERIDGHHAVVVGGGPAGLEAARRLLVRGAHVVLIEAESFLGGRMAQWGKAPSRPSAVKWVDWCERMLRAGGADIRLGHAADAATIVELHPDTVILAIGADDAGFPIESDGSSTLLGPRQSFRVDAPGTRVVVFDAVGALDGALMSDYLHSQGKHVTLVTSRIHAGEGEGLNSLIPMLRTLAEKGIEIQERRRPVRISRGEVEIEDLFGVSSTRIAADSMVVWTGGDPDSTLSSELRELGIDPLVIGDLLRPRRVLDATADAKRVADAVVRVEERA